MTRFYLNKSSEKIQSEITYLLKTWSKNQQHEITFSDSPNGAITVGTGEHNHLNISPAFALDKLPAFNSRSFIEDEKGHPDLISTAFCLINSLQEYNDPDRDELNRFKFTNSYQFTLRNTRENIVQHCFDEISKIAGHSPFREKSRFFLSHDIDLVNSAILEDGFNVLKRGRIDLFFQMLFNIAIGKPDWLNIDKIIKMESEYDCKSIFFWIVNKGKINQRERNADYSFSSNKIQAQFRMVEHNGFGNGIHKSISDETFDQEFVKYGKRPLANRYHYLKFNLPQAYHDIDEAGLKLDASLGFAEEIGFRNSYGAPFNPYNFKSGGPFSFVEAPLHVMDRTCFQYKKYPIEKAWENIHDFFEKNNENSVLSVLWHNNFFTNYKFRGYPELYKKILVYIRENNFKTISQEEILKRYSIV